MGRDRHEHHPAADRGRSSLRIALAITGGFFVVELAGAALTGSLALLADAGHMLNDAAALALALFASWIATRPPTPERTYGYHRAEVLAAMANAVALVAIALYVFWEAAQRLVAPPTVAALPMLVVAGAGLAANGASALMLGRFAEVSLNVRGAFVHVISDLLGSVGAIVAALIMLTTGWYYADPLVSMVVGTLVLISGWRLLRETVDVVLEAAPSFVDVREMERALRTLPGVVGVHDLHVWTVTSGFVAMSGHLTVRDERRDVVLRAATELLHQRYGIGHSTLQVESAEDEALLHGGCYFESGLSTCLRRTEGMGSQGEPTSPSSTASRSED